MNNWILLLLPISEVFLRCLYTIKSSQSTFTDCSPFNWKACQHQERISTNSQHDRDMGCSHSHGWRYYSFKLPYHFQEMWENRGISLWTPLLIIPVMTLQRLFVLKIVESSSDSLSETWLNYMNYGCAVSKYKALLTNPWTCSLWRCVATQISCFRFNCNTQIFKTNFFILRAKLNSICSLPVTHSCWGVSVG